MTTEDYSQTEKTTAERTNGEEQETTESPFIDWDDLIGSR